MNDQVSCSCHIFANAQLKGPHRANEITDTFSEKKKKLKTADIQRHGLFEPCYVRMVLQTEFCLQANTGCFRQSKFV